MMSFTEISSISLVTEMSNSTTLSIISVVWLTAGTPPCSGIAWIIRSTRSMEETFQDGFSGISIPGVVIVTGSVLVSFGSRTSVIVTGESMIQYGTGSNAPTSI